jgi:hypothetical protein
MSKRKRLNSNDDLKIIIEKELEKEKGEKEKVEKEEKDEK